MDGGPLDPVSAGAAADDHSLTGTQDITRAFIAIGDTEFDQRAVVVLAGLAAAFIRVGLAGACARLPCAAGTRRKALSLPVSAR